MDAGPSGASTAAASSNVSGPPRVAFTSNSHDFGTMNETQERSAAFEFTNLGGESLIVHEVKTSCGCTAARLAKREYAPGESGVLDVVFDPPGPGRKTSHVNLITNAQPEGRVRLTITADVEPFLIFEPPMLKLDVLQYGQEHRVGVSISSPDDQFVIESVGTTSAHATASIAPDDPQTTDASHGAKRVEVTIPSSAPWGGLYFALQVTARGRPFPEAQMVTHTSSIRVAGQLFGDLAAEPDMFRFGVGPGGAVERVVRLHSRTGRPFHVGAVAVMCPALPDASARAEKIAADTWQIVLTATAPARPVQCRGALKVTTDVPGEETIDVGILGVVRADSAGVR